MASITETPTNALPEALRLRQEKNNAGNIPCFARTSAETKWRNWRPRSRPWRNVSRCWKVVIIPISMVAVVAWDGGTDVPKCVYREAYGGDCGTPTQMMDQFCAEHLGLPCSICHGQARQGCSARVKGGPCGFPLCLAPGCQTEHQSKWHQK